MKVDSKTIMIIILVIALAIMGYINYSQKPVDSLDKELIEKEVKELKDDNFKLREELSEKSRIISGLRNNIDSLESLKPIAIKEYVEKSKKIDDSSVSATIIDLKRIFTDNGIK